MTPRAVYRWQRVFKDNYRISTSTEICGFLSLSLQSPEHFGPATGRFYKARADAAGRRHFFKCVFWNGAFRGCFAVPEEESQPLVMYQNGSSLFHWRNRGKIVLCDDGFQWRWSPKSGAGRWTVKSGTQRLLDLVSPVPETKGSIQIYSNSFLQRQEWQTLMLFFLYLGLGPQRPSCWTT